MNKSNDRIWVKLYQLSEEIIMPMKNKQPPPQEFFLRDDLSFQLEFRKFSLIRTTTNNLVAWNINFGIFREIQNMGIWMRWLVLYTFVCVYSKFAMLILFFEEDQESHGHLFDGNYTLMRLCFLWFKLNLLDAKQPQQFASHQGCIEKKRKEKRTALYIHNCVTFSYIHS